MQANPKLNILLLDQLESSARETLKQLDNLDANISLQTTGLQALAELAQMVPDLIISDAVLPDFDPYKLCYIIKHQADLKRIPFIILSANKDKLEQAKANFLGVDQLLAKPLKFRELIHSLKSLLPDKIDLVA